ncbi:hypothetical protein I6F37_05815 [Bradyrhizobium sp. NBAIM08]|uniref:DUF6321 domain-containing protein n=2 Tax=Nitrobacteraceae TaxID=41294 RepID=UPI0004B0E916|nr:MULTISPECIES: DUF6321 domain-containing protein [Bradyrhizobium]MCA1383675.1 hypothetical protein [Bradyrhizobium sp. BRP05]MCA1387493.1 hypothetical protein [Bradyrhizobium sp. IC3123]MCA1417914.1 hypothetical protein [Bradyrhizobium sp. BRP23]MCA1474535.1 hypothetical protein [Bradyrhizobium sp. NBAIM08]MCA1511867.1 hypothetical protein [Bradyrhizobium sp. NBAIM01]
MAKASRSPWKRANPRKRAGKASKHLSPAQKSAAKARARRAGRRYPNLVDNMRVAAKKTSKRKTPSKSKSSKAKSAKKSVRKTGKRNAKKTSKSSRKRVASAREKDPRGGLTAAGRKAFARKQGSHLRPGVTKKQSEMTPQEMRRKGSWAVRFYGRAKVPPLVDAKGQPTRHALSAHAWGEPVPRTVAAARRIAAKGERLLARYRRIKDNA